ncbi:YCII-related domain-containing protein OS=Streptomyces tendae OX=1932 GN=GUR47_24165 PE=4 SV=1 [Streptomyces tendae]
MDRNGKCLFSEGMIHHTMIVAFDNPIPASELDQYLSEFEGLVTESGLVESFAARHHIRVAGDDHAPVAVASAVLQLRLADLDALNATFTMPGAVDLIRRWQSRHPYKAVWVNHEPLA